MMFPSSCEQQSFEISSEDDGGYFPNTDLAKRRKSDCSDSNNLFDSIGREISISCLLRCSPFDYASLACVNRGFRSLIRSGELYRLRRLQGITESWVYILCELDEWQVYDLHRARWINLPKMPHNDSFMSSVKDCLVVGTELLFFGMLSNSQLVLKYSILTNSWSPGTVMNSPRCWFGSASFEAKAICAGGCDTDGAIFSSAELYDSESKTWTTLPSMHKARKMCSGVFMDGKFYVIGGSSHRGKQLTCGEEFDMEKGSWRIIPNTLAGLNTVNRARTVITVRNNELYATHYEDK